MSEEIAIIEMIKPSSPTPPQLRKLQLSFLDQLTPPFYIHIILYLEAARHHHQESNETSRMLKQSLSNVLAIYYPLAGRLTEENSWVDCNDAGAEYVEVRFNDHRISDIVENPPTDELKQYVPSAPSGGHDIPLAVQVSFFGCGGTAIGVCMSHKLADAMSMVTFINSWAAACRGDAETIASTQPNFGLASRFPPLGIWPSPPSSVPPPSPGPPPKIITRSFIFDQQKLAALKRGVSGPLMETPTRVEAVSAFIWKHIIEATASRDKTLNRVFAATHVVDIRLRACPSLPHQFFGNACARVMAMTTEEKQADHNYYGLAVKLREMIRKADPDYITRLQDGDTFMKYYSANEENDPVFKDGKKILDFCCFTSWHRLPVYDADFGWGKPVWVSVINLPYKNLIFFLGTKSGDGIEAWVNMLEEDIKLIENSYQLL